MKKLLLKGLLEGFVGTVVLDCATTFTVSLNEPSIVPVLIGLLGAGIYTAVYALLAQRYKTNKDLICFSLIGLFSFILFLPGMLALHIINPFGFMPLREANNADSIMLLLCIACFAVTSTILKLCKLIIVIIRNSTGSTGDGTKTGDGSLS